MLREEYGSHAQASFRCYQRSIVVTLKSIPYALILC
jgi:hypothetical protein